MLYLHSQYGTSIASFFKTKIRNAKIAQLVERDLAKVEVAGSNPVFRSRLPKKYFCSSGGIGRHAGLKIQWVVMPVRVQVPP